MSTQSSPALPAGTVIDSGSAAYTIRSVIGSGGFGITYLASMPVKVGNVKASIDVAIKELFLSSDCERSADDDTTIRTSGPAAQRMALALKDFMAEATRLHEISGLNDNIVNVNEVFRANGTAYYVMEYLRGPSLRDLVTKNGPMDERQALEFIRPIAKAVEFLHSRKIMHLDVKPANIVINDDAGQEGDGKGRERPVLIDFGQSKHFDNNGSLTCTLSSTGFSEGYAPMEQYAGITKFSPEADVYSLGATLLFCLTGRKPPRAIEMSRAYIDSVLPKSISPATRKALHKALAVMPAERTGSVPEFLASLPTATAEPEKPKRDTNKLLKRIIIAGIIGIAAISAIHIYRSSHSEPDYYGEPVTITDSDESPVEAAVPDNTNESNTAQEAAETEELAAAIEEGPAAIEEEEVRSGTPPPLMHTYNFSGYFTDGLTRWPVKLTARTDNSGNWGNCVYTNVSQNVVLNMKGSGSNDSFTFRSEGSGTGLTIHLSYEGEGTWSGTATSGSTTLNVVLYE